MQSPNIFQSSVLVDKVNTMRNPTGTKHDNPVNNAASFLFPSSLFSTAGFVRSVVPGAQGPAPGGPDVSLLADPGGRQPAVEGEVQGRR